MVNLPPWIVSLRHFACEMTCFPSGTWQVCILINFFCPSTHLSIHVELQGRGGRTGNPVQPAHILRVIIGPQVFLLSDAGICHCPSCSCPSTGQQLSRRVREQFADFGQSSLRNDIFWGARSHLSSNCSKTTHRLLIKHHMHMLRVYGHRRWWRSPRQVSVSPTRCLLSDSPLPHWI